MEEPNDVIQDSSPEDVIAESSPAEPEEEQVQEPEEPTSPKGVEEQHVPYSRFKEINDERKYWQEKAIEVASRQPVPVQPQEEIDPYSQFQDPNTRVFYQDLDKRILKMAKKIAEEEKAPIIRQNEILSQQLASIQHKMFKSENTDVAENSPEEMRIAQLVSTGTMTLEEATWAVMGPKRVARTKQEETQKQQKNQRVDMKVKANLATQTGVPVKSGLPQNRQGFLEELADRLDKDWNGNLG